MGSKRKAESMFNRGRSSFARRLKKKMGRIKSGNRRKTGRGLKKFLKKLKRVGRKVAKAAQKIIKNKGVQRLISGVAKVIPVVGGRLGAIADQEFGKLNKIQMKRAAKQIKKMRDTVDIGARKTSKRRPLSSKSSNISSTTRQTAAYQPAGGYHTMASGGRKFLL